MSETKEMTGRTALSSLTDTDRVYVERNGTLEPTTFAALAKAVRDGIKVGGRNLLKQSNIEKSVVSEDSGYGAYLFSQPLEIGKTYMVTACISVDSPLSRLVISLNGASFHNVVQFYNVPSCDKEIFTGLITLTRASQSFYVWKASGRFTLHWATLTEGTVESGGWFPAPEDLESAKSGGVICSTLYAITPPGEKGGLQYECNDGTFRGYAQEYSCGCYGLPWNGEGAFGRGDSAGEIHNGRFYARIGADEVFRIRKHSAISATGGDEPRRSRHYPKGDGNEQRSTECSYARVPSRDVEAVVQGSGNSALLIEARRRKEVMV